MDNKIAVIDLGTNTFHLLLALINSDKFDTLYKEKIAVKIGQGGINEGYITEEAKERAFAAIEKFKYLIDQEGIKKTYATATSAIRNAKNGVEFTKEVFKRTGINIRIINGEQEADYIHYGVSKAVNFGKETSLIMDIGGGSIEFILCNNQNVFWKGSFEIGAQRLLDKFHYHDPIHKAEIENLERYLEANLLRLDKYVKKYNPTSLIGSSGTFDTLSDIYTFENNIEREPDFTELPLPLEKYFEIHEEIIHKDRAQRLAIPGMIELRVDMIVVASCLIKFILKKYKISNLRVSTYALKEGLLFNIIDKHQISDNT
jgi:exopolyphosphatase / guanosine-5'-triphosphate,3'-diphosphate pyrophosphatase